MSSDVSSPNMFERPQPGRHSSQQVAALFVKQLTSRNKFERKETVKELKRKVTKKRIKESKQGQQNVPILPTKRLIQKSPLKQSVKKSAVNLLTPPQETVQSLTRMGKRMGNSPNGDSRVSNYIDPEQISLQFDSGDHFNEDGSLFSPDMAMTEALKSSIQSNKLLALAQMNKTQSAISKLMKRRIIQTIEKNTALRQSPEIGMMLKHNNFSVNELQAIELELNLKNLKNQAAEQSTAEKHFKIRESKLSTIREETRHLSMASSMTEFERDEIQSLTQIRIRNEYHRSLTKMGQKRFVMYQTNRRFHVFLTPLERWFNRITFVDPKYLISPSDSRKEAWDVMVLFLAIFMAFLTPIEIAFEPSFSTIPVFFAFELLIDLVFIVDMVLTCLTKYRDDKGHEVRDSSKIIKKYIRSYRRFLPDLLAIFGNTMLAYKIPRMKIFTVFKVVRVLRLGQMITQSTFPRQIKAPLKLVKHTLYLVIYINGVSCAWWSIVSAKAQQVDEDGLFIHWYPPTYWINYKQYNLFDSSHSLPEKYLICLYHSVLMLGFNEMGPVNMVEMGFCAAVMLSASFLNAHIFSEMVVIMHSFNRRQQNQQEMLDKSNSVLATLNMPIEMQKEVQEYFYMTVNTREDQQEFDRFLDQISPSKKELVQKKVFEQNLLMNPCVQTYTGTEPPLLNRKYTIRDKFLRTVRKSLSLTMFASKRANEPPLLHSLSKRSQLENMDEESAAFMAKLVSYLGTFLAIPEEEIITYGDLGRSMYFMSKGDCIVKLFDMNGKLFFSERLLDEGQHFGEVALMYNCRRTATVISRNFNTMARFSYSSYREVVNLYPEFQKHIKHQLFNYNDPRKNALKKILMEVDYFKSNISCEAIHELIYKSATKTYEKGQQILKEDQPVDSIMIVEYGVLEVYTEFEGHEFIIDKLYQGTIINALAFLTEDIMYVNLRCAENSKIFELPRTLISEFQEEHIQIRNQMQRYQNIMLLTQKKYPLDYLHKVPNLIIPRENYKSSREYEQFLDRRNTLKNVVFRRIIQLRQIKKRPKLNTLLKMFQDNGDPAEKEIFINKIKNLYKQEENLIAKNFETNPKYEKITLLFHRILKMMKIAQEGIQTADLKLAKLLIRRYKREDMILNIKDDFFFKIKQKILSQHKKQSLINAIDFKANEEHRLATERAKSGFNPFYHHHFVKGRKYVDEYFQLDEDFDERMENFNATTKVVKIDGREQLLHKLDQELNKFGRLTKIAGVRKRRKSTDLDLPAFKSPHQQIDLSIFKRKKRSAIIKELIHDMQSPGGSSISQAYSSLTLDEALMSPTVTIGQHDSPDKVVVKNASQFAKIDEILLSDDDESEQSQFVPQPPPPRRQSVSSSGATTSLMDGSMRLDMDDIDVVVSSLGSSDGSEEITSKFLVVHSQIKQQIIREDMKNLKVDLLLLPTARRSSVRVPELIHHSFGNNS